uniref:Uncharacterized protein n=1 Tax=Anguilla anguilla TaxID=7936 RepID=A0A0E9QAU0_ANGAN
MLIWSCCSKLQMKGCQQCDSTTSLSIIREIGACLNVFNLAQDNKTNPVSELYAGPC